MSQRDRPRQERWQDQQHPAREWRDAQIRLTSQVTSRGTKYRFRVRTTADQCGQSDRFIMRRPLATLDRVGEAADLHVDRIAETQTLVAKVADQLRFEILGRRIDMPDGFEKGKRKEGVDSG